jgi:hypothetical protein
LATVAERITVPTPRPDALSGTPRANAIDRWIFVFMAGWFIAIVLTGFIPDSLEKIAAVQAGERPAFPLVLHFHAVLMGSFLLVLLAQTWLMATGRGALHKQLGIVGIALAIALIVAGFILVPTNYGLLWEVAHSGAPGAAETFGRELHRWENIMLLQLRAGILFALFLAIAVTARSGNAGLHKRMMFLATAVALPAALNRMHWLPSTLPGSPLSGELYTLAAVAPMFVWDAIRNGRVHLAYWVWLAAWLPTLVAANMAWNTPWWHATARQLLGF